jgi:hypothetical protein
MRFTTCAAVMTAMLLPVAAFADEESDDDAAMPDAAAATIEARRGVDEGQLRDPNIDRGFLLPTAETQPAGSISFNSYELFFEGITYGVTDDLHITGTVLTLNTDSFWMGNVSAKYRFLKTGRLRLAAQGSVTFIHTDIDEDLEETHTFFTAGAIASICVDEGCNSLVSASATTGLSANTDERPVIYGVSAVQSIAPHVKLVGEFVSAGMFDGSDWDGADGGLLNYGVRFTSDRIAGDVGFLRPIGSDSDVFPLGIPFINFTYRAL